MFPGDGQGKGGSYGAYVRGELARAHDARRDQTRQDRLGPTALTGEPHKYAGPAEVTAKEEPEVVSEEPTIDEFGREATRVTYSDGSVWTVTHEFSRFTERVETYWERVREGGE